MDNATSTQTPTTTETPASPEVGTGRGRVTFADIAAARRSAANALPPPAPRPEEPKASTTPAGTGTEPPKPETAPGPGTPPGNAVEVDIDENALGQFVGLSKELRQARARAKELEARAAAADKHDQITKLLAEGKALEALQLLDPTAFDKATAEALGTKPTNDPVADLKAEMEKLKADKAAEDKAKAEAQAKEQAAHDEAERAKIVDEVSKLSDKFPFLAAKPAEIRSALAEAEKAYEILVKENGGEDLSPEERRKLLRAAIEEGEHRLKTDYEALHAAASRKSGGTDSKPETAPTFTGEMRGGTAPTVPAKKMSFEEVRRARQATRHA